MKIDIDYVINTLKTIYVESNYHQDFVELNKKKLKVLNNILFEEELIHFDSKTKTYNFKMINDNYFNKSALGYFPHSNAEKINSIIEKTDTGLLIDNINDTINQVFELYTRNNKIRSGLTLCSNEEYEHFWRNLEVREKELVISSHIEQVNKEYRKVIKKCIQILYKKDRGSFNNRVVNPIGWKINFEFGINENELKQKKILDTYLSEYDYI
ncbi:hypothetical protein HOK00_11135 [bacterium]|jgi:hypothetical protein|nr:hypothetical protein [bacterium]